MSTAPSRPGAAAGPERTERGYPALTGLSEREREVYVSCELEGLRPADVAEYMDVAPSTVRTLLARSRSKRGER